MVTDSTGRTPAGRPPAHPTIEFVLIHADTVEFCRAPAPTTGDVAHLLRNHIPSAVCIEIDQDTIDSEPDEIGQLYVWSRSDQPGPNAHPNLLATSILGNLGDDRIHYGTVAVAGADDHWPIIETYLLPGAVAFIDALARSAGATVTRREMATVPPPRPNHRSTVDGPARITCVALPTPGRFGGVDLLPCIVTNPREYAPIPASVERAAIRAAGLALLSDLDGDVRRTRITHWRAEFSLFGSGRIRSTITGKLPFADIAYPEGWPALVRNSNDTVALYYLPSSHYPHNHGPVLADMQRCLNQGDLYGGMLTVEWTST